MRFVFLLGLFHLLISCTIEQENHLQDFEAPLLLTWVAVQQRDAAAAVQYNEDLQAEWAQLDSEYGHFAHQREWRQHYRAMALWVDKLDRAIGTADWHAAELRIEQIQDELRSLRLRYGIESPADRLYAAHRQWAAVVQISHDPLLCLYEWNEYELIIDQAEGAWADWLACGPAYYPELFPGTRERAAIVRSRADSLTTLMADFELLLREGDQTLTLAPSSEIQQLWQRYLTALLNFPIREKVLG